MYERITSIDGNEPAKQNTSNNFYNSIGSESVENKVSESGCLRVKVGPAILVYTKQENKDLRRHMMKIYDATTEQWVNIGAITEYDGKINYVEMLENENVQLALPKKKHPITGKIVDVEDGDTFIMDVPGQVQIN